MGRSLQKVQEQISKKRHGKLDTLHQKSRDSRRLQRALVRDEKLDKIAASRRKNEQPRLERVSYFQNVVKENDGAPLEIPVIQQRIREFVHQYDDEYDMVKKARRPGRPPSTREHMLKMKMEELKQEYKNGFFLPDISNEETAKQLEKWAGSWAYLSNLSWVKVAQDGSIKASVWSLDK